MKAQAFPLHLVAGPHANSRLGVVEAGRGLRELSAWLRERADLHRERMGLGLGGGPDGVGTVGQDEARRDFWHTGRVQSRAHAGLSMAGRGAGFPFSRGLKL